MSNNLLASLSLDQLQRAVAIKERIAALEIDLSRILHVASSLTPKVNRGGRRKRSVSAVAKPRTVVASKSPAAKGNGKLASASARKPRRKMSAETRAKMSEAAKARWAKSAKPVTTASRA